ncbi:MAG: ArsB/NhaD family transporter, partial [Rhodothermia bacterium]|nr:ArsB/NhaD family transporter [Rhodothermia bacterium]
MSALLWQQLEQGAARIHAAVQWFSPRMAFWIATGLFVAVYVAIIFFEKKLHKTKIALMGAALMLLLQITTQKDAFHSEALGVDWNVIFLLISMMIIIAVLRGTGLFEAIALWAVRVSRGRPFAIMAMLNGVTAVLSAFLDNVTTVLLIAPVTIAICRDLRLSPVPFLISEALASNIGGTATLIGDPPNIMIASRAQLAFMDFIYHLSPVVLIILVLYIGILRLLFAHRLKVSEEDRERVLALHPRDQIKNPELLRRGLFVLGMVILGFMLHGLLGYEPATVALFGAALLLLLTPDNPHHILQEVEWNTIFFFIGLFVVIGGIVKVGLIKVLAQWVIGVTAGDLLAMTMLILWGSALLSAFVDNIPYVATMNPLIIEMALNEPAWRGQTLQETLHHPELLPIWWALALGACLGGNGTYIGASANVIVVGLAERARHKITFVEFFKYGFPIM